MLVGQKSPMAVLGLADDLRATPAENFIGFACVFVVREEREKPAYEYVGALREEIQTLLSSSYAAAQLTLVAETGQPSNAEPLGITLMGDDMDELQAISAADQKALAGIEGVAEVRDLAAKIRYAMSSDTIGKFAVAGIKDDLDIKLGMAWPSRKGKSGGPTRLEELSFVRAFTPEGESVSLLAFINPDMDMAPLSITHKDARRLVSVLGNVNDRVPTEIIKEFTPKLDEMQKKWLSGTRYSIGAEAQEKAETFASAGAMLVIAIILVFSVLGLVLVFGSFLQSLIIIATMPLAMIGTFLGFLLLQIPFSFFAMVGVIALIGIVINDAIVMIDTMNRHLLRGMVVAEAAAHGESDRLRPIISTSLTAIVGLIPLAISNPMWRALCYAVIFGLIASTVLALIVVPCLYVLLTKEPASTRRFLSSHDRGLQILISKLEGN